MFSLVHEDKRYLITGYRSIANDNGKLAVLTGYI